MGAWKRRKPEPSHIQGVCVICNEKPQRKNYNNTYKPVCKSCENNGYKRKEPRVPKPKKITEPREYKFNYRSVKKDYCEECGFQSSFRCQFDVDHIDGDHSNDSLDNLQTLCANCHRLKTWNDWQKKRPQGNESEEPL